MTEEYSRLYIDGEWIEVEDRLETVFPFSGEAWATFPRGTAAHVDDAVAAARKALDSEWGTTTIEERADLMESLASVLEERAERIAQVETHDNGKPIGETRGMANALPGWYRFFAAVCRTLDGRSLEYPARGAHVYTKEEPVGVVGAITPYNSPILLATWKLAPAFAAGAPVVLKPSKHTPASALEFAACVDEVGFPPGAFNVVTGTGSEVGDAIATHEGIDKLSFTGGTEAGRHIARSGGENLIPLTLELGGKSANIVFEDADLDLVIPGSTAAIFKSTGQSCTAGSRLFVHESVHDEVVSGIVDVAESITLGDPREPSTTMGPISHPDQHEKVCSMLEVARGDGATIARGGSSLTVDGCDLFVEPTVLTDVTNDMRIAQEEVFGPVLSVIPFTEEADAVQWANDSDYGLAAGLWTEDYRRAHRVAEQLDVGRVWVNMYKASAYNAPQGGRKASGYGVENGIKALEAYSVPKSVWMNLDTEVTNPYE